MPINPEYDKISCLRCGACCKLPGYVRISAKEADRIAALLELTPHAFIESYTRLTHDRQGLSLTEREDGACVFLSDHSLCLIQAAKPRQCRDFPSRWRYPETAKVCPAAAQAHKRSSTGTGSPAAGIPGKANRKR